jgi:hypothetical protein
LQFFTSCEGGMASRILLSAAGSVGTPPAEAGRGGPGGGDRGSIAEKAKVTST